MAYTDYFDTVQEAYIAYYQRPADPDGLIYWAKILDMNGGNLDLMIEQFANSEEAKDLYGSIDKSNIDNVITAIYQAAFNRAPEQAGLDFYHQGFVEGKFTPATIMLDIVNGAQNSDKLTLENKVMAAMEFTKTIDPDLDGNDLLATYDAQDIPAAREYLKMVDDKASSIPTTIEAMAYVKDHIANPGDPIMDIPTGETFTLTSGADNIIGTPGDDIVKATNTTLSAGDQIHGDGGTDTLKYQGNSDTSHTAFEMDGVENVIATSDSNANISFDMSGTHGVKDFTTFNSTGDVVFDHVTELANLTVNNLTAGNNWVTEAIHFADSVVAGGNDEITLNLVNNVHAEAGIIQIGSDSAPDAGIETLDIVTSGAATNVLQIDSDVSTMNISGDQNLTVDTPLNATIDTLNASALSGDLNVSLVGNVPATDSQGNVEGALHVTTGSGNDTIDMTDITRDAIVDLGAGNDKLEQAGMGDDDIKLGAGDDFIHFDGNEALTVLDTVDGGAGLDTMHITNENSLTHSELENVSSIETIDLKGAGGIRMELSDNLVDTLSDTDTLTVNDDDAGARQTIDLTYVSFNKTSHIEINGGAKGESGDTVIANDATVNAKAHLNFADNDGAVNAVAKYYANEGDILEIRNGGTYTADDFSNVSGLDQIRLTTDSNVAQTYDITLNPNMIDNWDSTNALGDGTDDLVIYVDRNMPQGSVVNVNGAALKPNQNVTVLTNSNVTVNTTGANVNVQTVLEFTENADNLIGTAGADLFTADSLDQLDSSDHADGNGGRDTLQLDFAIHNGMWSLDTDLNGADIQNIQILDFNTKNDILFGDNDYSGYDFDTFDLGSGNDTVIHADNTVGPDTINGNAGNDLVDVLWKGVPVTFNGGAGNDTMTNADYTDPSGMVWSGRTYTSLDHFDPGSGVDTLVDTQGGNWVIGDLANFITGTAGNLENFDVNLPSTATANVRLGTIDMNEFANGVANVSVSAQDGVVTAAANTDATLKANFDITFSANTMQVGGGVGDDTITVTDTTTAGVANIAGGRGEDTITLKDTTPGGAVEHVIFKTAQDGGLEGMNAGFDHIIGFTSGQDTIDFSTSAGAYTDATIYGNGFFGDAVDTDASGAINPTAVNAATLDLASGKDELALFTGTGLSDADLTDLSTVSSWLAANTALTDSASASGTLVVGDHIVFAIQGTNDTAIYWFTSDDTNGDATADEISILGVVEDQHLATTDFQLA